MKIVAFVPAKAHSDRVSNKNLAILDGEHLFKRKLKQLLDVELINQVCLDTESKEIAGKASDLAVTLLDRPVELASNKADGHDIFEFECAAVPDADIYIQALCTAPFVDTATITRAVQVLLDDKDADSLVATTVTKQYLWQEGIPAYGLGRIPNSVDLPETVVEAMSLYMVRRRPGDAPPKRRIGMKTILFPLTAIENIDVNYPIDLELAEKICAGERAQSNLKLDILRAHISSPILADICKEMGIKAVMAPNIKQVSGQKILGVAKTLKLVELTREDKQQNPDKWKDIYTALDSYKFIRPGDIIIVSTNVPEKAYFGDLNANLAIRAGARGAIIDGYTRDTTNVENLGFSVFAHGSYCDDIKYEGVVESMNMAMEVGGVKVRNGDYIFADGDGVVVIPRQKWPEIEHLAWEALRREAEIKLNVMQGRSVEHILNRHGSF